MEKISSLQNQKIRNIIHLSKSKERRSQQLILIEGYREICMAYEFGYEIKEIYFCSEANLHPDTHLLLSRIDKCYEISKIVFDKVAYRENSDGLIAVAIPKIFALSHLKLSALPLLLVIESVEKPGNLGALLRTADAAALDAILVCDPQTDIYNPNVIRSSLGCIFSQKVITCTTSEAIRFLKERNIKTYAAALTAKQAYHKTDFTIPCAIIMGTEANGLSNEWLQKADLQILIPMQGKVDSLNVSVSAAILVFEAKRQRGF